MFSGRVEERDGSYVVEVPEQELRIGDVDEETPYRVAVLSTPTETTEETERESAPEHESEQEREPAQEHGTLEPPVDEGETRVVEIEDVGDQGDGITRVERGYVVIVPDAEKRERVRIEITQVQDNVAFADVVERLDYYE